MAVCGQLGKKYSLYGREKNKINPEEK